MVCMFTSSSTSRCDFVILLQITCSTAWIDVKLQIWQVVISKNIFEPHFRAFIFSWMRMSLPLNVKISTEMTESIVSKWSKCHFDLGKKCSVILLPSFQRIVLPWVSKVVKHPQSLFWLSCKSDLILIFAATVYPGQIKYGKWFTIEDILTPCSH